MSVSHKGAQEMHHAKLKGLLYFQRSDLLRSVDCYQSLFCVAIYTSMNCGEPKCQFCIIRSVLDVLSEMCF